MAEQRIWSTENGEYVVWGTHDAVEAERLTQLWAKDHGEEGAHYPGVITWSSGHKIWAAPEMINEEYWPEDQYSIERAVEDNWVPLLVVEWWEWWEWD